MANTYKRPCWPDHGNDWGAANISPEDNDYVDADNHEQSPNGTYQQK